MTNVLTGKFWLSVVVIFVLSMAIGFGVHGLLLGSHYAALPSVFRQPQDQGGYFIFFVIAHVLFAAAFVWIYLHGREAKPYLAQGLRYGAAIAILSTIPTYLIYYAVLPLPPILPVQQIVFDTVGVLVLGVSVAWLNR